MSMVSYFNPAAVYRHQQAMSGQTGQMHHPGSWYGGPGYHQGQVPGAGGYCMQEEQNLWHHPHHGSIFHQEFGPEFQLPAQHHAGQGFEQLPSPPITVSGSELSSPGGGGNASPGNAAARPPPVRSPFEWMKKTAFQSQPNSANKTRTKDKYRVVYTDYQRIELEKEFSLINKYISIRRKSELALNLGLSERQIKIWFQNRRAKERKLLKKRLEENPVKDEDPVSHAAQIQQFEQKMQMMQNQQNQHCGQMQMGQGQMTRVELLSPDYASLRTTVPN